MKTKTIKLIIITMILISFLLIFLPKNVYAAPDSPSFSLKNIFNSVKTFLSQGSAEGDFEVGREITNEIQPIINALYWVGVAVVMGASMFLGIQYFQTTADPQAKAALQSKLVGFLISSVVLLSAYPIWKYLVQILSEVINLGD